MHPYLTPLGNLHSHLQSAAPAGPGRRLVVFPPAAEGPGRNPGRWEQAFLGRPGGAGRGQGPHLLPVCLSWEQTCPCWPPIPPSLPPGISPGALSLRRALRGSGGGLALLPAGGDFSCLGTELVPTVPLLHAFGRVGCFLAGCCYGLPAPAGGRGDFPGRPAGPPTGSLSSPYSSMRPPGSSCFSAAGPAVPPGMAGGPAPAGLSRRLRPLPLSAGISPGRSLPGLSGAPVHLSGSVSGHPGGGPAPAAAAHRPALTRKTPLTPFRFSVRGCRFILRGDWNRLSKS